VDGRVKPGHDDLYSGKAGLSSASLPELHPAISMTHRRHRLFVARKGPRPYSVLVRALELVRGVPSLPPPAASSSARNGRSASPLMMTRSSGASPVAI